MGYKKISPEMEDFILKGIGANITYREIVKEVKEKFGISLSVMAISALKKRVMESITTEFHDELKKERKVELDIKRESLSNCLSMGLELCENELYELMDKQDTKGLTRSDVNKFNSIIDRVIKMKSILTAEVEFSTEGEFSMDKIRKKYKIKKRVND